MRNLSLPPVIVISFITQLDKIMYSNIGFFQNHSTYNFIYLSTIGQEELCQNVAIEIVLLNIHGKYLTDEQPIIISQLSLFWYCKRQTYWILIYYTFVENGAFFTKMKSEIYWMYVIDWISCISISLHSPNHPTTNSPTHNHPTTNHPKYPHNHLYRRFET